MASNVMAVEDNTFLDIVKKNVDEVILDEDLTNVSYMDTGSYALNALCSGSIYGGVPDSRITLYAGDEATGKTFFCLSAMKTFLSENTNSRILFYDTEMTMEPSFFDKRGIDSNRVLIVRPDTVEEMTTQMINIVDKYQAAGIDQRVMIVVDSFGNIASLKEIEDAAKGDEKADFTRTKQLKKFFRIMTNKLGKANIPLIGTNHVYVDIMGYGGGKKMSGGSGLKYMGSLIVFLSKTKDKDSPNGYILTALSFKSRYSKPLKKVQLKLDFNTGLDRYYGLVDIALELGVFEKDGNKVRVPAGTSHFAKHIWSNPEKFFTKEVLDEIDKKCQVYFGLGVVNEYNDANIEGITEEQELSTEDDTSN